MKFVSQKGTNRELLFVQGLHAIYYTHSVLKKDFLCVCQCFLVPAGPLPGARDDGEPLKDWMIAVIVLVAGLLLLAIVVLALCCFKRRKKEHGGKYKTVWTVVIQEKKLDASGYF